MTMKTSFKLLAAAALLVLCSFPARAQQFSESTSVSTNGSFPLNGGTNRAIALTTNTLNYPITVTKDQEIALSLSFKYVSSGAGTMTFRVVPGTATAPDTQGHTSYVITGNGTTGVQLTTNIYVGSAGYLWLVDNWNTNAQAATNISVKIVRKPQRYGGFGP